MARAALWKQSWPTLLVWTLHLACVAATLAFAAIFVLMATSLDPMEMVTAGVEPWTSALAWSLAVLGMVVVAAIGLRLWHSRRLWAVGVILLSVEIGARVWAGWAVYADYF